MKKIFVILSVALMPLVALTACGDDDDDDNPVVTDLATAIAGTYSASDFDVTIGGEPVTLPGSQSLTITRTSDTKAKLVLNGLQIPGGADPETEEPVFVSLPIEISGVTLSGSENNVALEYKGSINIGTGDLSFPDSEITMDKDKCTVKNKKDLDMTIDISIDLAGDGTGVPVTVVIKGTKSTAVQ